MSTNTNPTSISSTSGMSCSNVYALNPIKNNLIVNFPSGYNDILGKSIVKGGVCILEPIIGILHHIGSWGDCGITGKNMNIKPLPETFSGLLVGIEMSSNTNLYSMSDENDSWSCYNVRNISPQNNNLIVSFPSGFTDYNGNKLSTGSVCIIEPVIGTLHWVGSFSDCSNNFDLSKFQTMAINSSSGPFIVGDSLSSVGFPCSKLNSLKYINNKKIFLFTNGYEDNFGNSIPKGGICIINPVSHNSYYFLQNYI